MTLKFPPLLPREITLPDGSKMLIRQTRPEDREAFLDGFDRLSCQSIYDRFFTDKSKLSDEDLAYFVQPNLDSHVSLVAESPKLDGSLIASFRYIVDAENPERAEFACIVDDEFQNRGIGRIMFRQLMAVAKERDVKELVGTALSTNDRVVRMIESVNGNLEISQHPSFREIRIKL